MSEPRPQGVPGGPGAAWRRWEMDSVAPRRAAPADGPLEAPIADETRERIDRLSRQAREKASAEGHAQGYAQGHAKGLDEGRSAGRAEGLEAGRREGFDAGHAAGLEEGRARAAAEAAQLASLAQACAAALRDIEAQAGQALISLSVDIARQVLRTALEVDRDKILDTVRDILQLDIGHDALLRLRAHPDDVSLIQAYLDTDPAARHWRLQGDETIERGGCVAETSLGSIDATLQTRWERVVGALGDTRPWIRLS